jgi:predicted dehydrogenase
MLRIAIIGCGKIADSHAAQISRIGGCEIVGVCDQEPLMARQLYERFAVERYFDDVDTMLRESRPDVVHVTTPPGSHYAIAKRCLEQGCHVYVEKPFTVDADQAGELIALAQRRGLKVTAGHDDQFSHVTRRMRALVREGYLGGAPIHMESWFCYELGQAYARALLSDRAHWVRALPGKLLHNIISHGVARIAEYLEGDAPEVIVHGHSSPLLQGLGETEIVDELRVIIAEAGQRTAYFTFSSQMRPVLHQFALYGPANGLLLDQDHEILLKLRGTGYRSYLEKFVPPLGFARQHLANLAGNVRKFLARDFHAKAGMHFLIAAFYRSITEGTAVPIPYREILLTARIMDDIFRQLNRAQSPQSDPAPSDAEMTPQGATP